MNDAAGACALHAPSSPAPPERCAAGAYAGLDRAECRKRLWADLKEQGLAIKEEPHTLRVPRSQRGGEVRPAAAGGGARCAHAQQIIEPLVSEQWFIRMETLAAPGAGRHRALQLLVSPAPAPPQLWPRWRAASCASCPRASSVCMAAG